MCESRGHREGVVHEKSRPNVLINGLEQPGRAIVSNTLLTKPQPIFVHMCVSPLSCPDAEVDVLQPHELVNFPCHGGGELYSLQRDSQRSVTGLGLRSGSRL